VTVGMGVALVPRCLVQDEITAGVVDEPLAGGGYQSSLGYWFCYPEARARLGPLVRFRSWLLDLPEVGDGITPAPVVPVQG
jgi:LysR family glycine cleavage system transcriptional activator